MTATFLNPNKITEIKESIASNTGRYINPSKIDGSIRFRFFGQGRTGYEGWVELEGGKNKPVRWEELPDETDLPPNIRLTDGKPQIKRFIAGIVYEYKLNKSGEIVEDEGQFKIITISQKSIMEQLFKYIADADYGDPNGYDIKLARTGEGLKTEYTLTPAPPKAVAKSITALWEKEQDSIDLDAYMACDDPFKSDAA
jgi:hypothetical protein